MKTIDAIYRKLKICQIQDVWKLMGKERKLWHDFYF